jgi:hypothetical protein
MLRVSLWLAIGMFGAVFPAAADNFSIWNCTNQTIEFKLYNEGDIACWIPKHTFTLSKCGSSFTYQCEGKCQVHPLGGSGCNYAKLSGSWTLFEGSKNINGVIYVKDGNNRTWVESTEGGECTLC